MMSCEVTEVSGQAGDLSATFRQRVRRSTTLLELCAIVCCDAINHDKSDVESLDCHWDLILQDVFLCFKVMDMSTLDPSE